VKKQKKTTLFSLLVVFSNIYFDPPIADEIEVVIPKAAVGTTNKRFNLS
jgi:hypothetical protein